MTRGSGIALSGVGLMLVMASSMWAQQTAPPPSSPEPLCTASADPAHGLSVVRAVPVGGGAMYAAARERRYLDALRGPKGEVVRYTRNGSTMPPGTDDPVDVYTVTYDGLEAPLTLYLDAYHFSDPKAPQGLVCAKPMSLGLPPPDQFLGAEQLDALAAEIAAAPGFRAGPVDLGGDPPIGLLLDAFRVKARRARVPAAAPAAGATPQTPPVRTTVVAFPQSCGGRVVAPSAIALVGSDGQVVDAIATETLLAAVRARFPGQEIPAGSTAATFAADALQVQFQVRVTFADAACTTIPTRDSALEYLPAQLIESPMPARPVDDTSGVPWVAVQAVIDHQGAFQQVRALGGPPALAKVAEAAVRAWKARPQRAGPAPIAAPVTLQITFTAPVPR